MSGERVFPIPKRGQMEWQDNRGVWWPEGSIPPWDKIVSMRQIIYPTKNQYREWVLKFNKKLSAEGEK